MDRLQIIVVAKIMTVLQLFISRMPKMCANPQLVSAPLNPIATVEHFRRSKKLSVLLQQLTYEINDKIYFLQEHKKPALVVALLQNQL